MNIVVQQSAYINRFVVLYYVRRPLNLIDYISTIYNKYGLPKVKVFLSTLMEVIIILIVIFLTVNSFESNQSRNKHVFFFFLPEQLHL